MKFEITRKEKVFEPISLTIEIESVDELIELCDRFYVDVTQGSLDLSETLKKEIEESLPASENQAILNIYSNLQDLVDEYDG